MSDAQPWQRLLHRCFVQYNPLYLVSAALVLVGVILLSRSVATDAGPLGQIGITAITEIYACALIGGAALLTRIHLRRPAVMLALLAALYQFDLTLHTETSVHMGWLGVLGSLGWLALFVVKLGMIAWALRLRPSRSALLVPTIAAIGLALVPWLLRDLDARSATALVGMWLFVLFGAGLWTSRRVRSLVVLGCSSSVVKDHLLLATWFGGAVMVLAHVAFWATQHARTLGLFVLIPVGLLLATRLCARERGVWALVASALAFGALLMPSQFVSIAGMAAAALVLRALRQPVVQPHAVDAVPSFGPYRDEAGEPLATPLARPTIEFVVAHRRAMLRLFAGAIGCVYLAMWTPAWTGGPWPMHAWWLDLLLVAITAIWAKRLRDPLPLALPVATMFHCVLQLRVVPAPSSMGQWGATCVVVGFALLMLSLAAAFAVRKRGC